MAYLRATAGGSDAPPPAGAAAGDGSAGAAGGSDERDTLAPGALPAGGAVASAAGSPGAAAAPPPAQRRTSARLANLQLLLGLMALVASTSFAVKRQFLDPRAGRVVAGALPALRRPASLDDPDEQLALLLELRAEQKRLQRQRASQDEDEDGGGSGSSSGGADAAADPAAAEAALDEQLEAAIKRVAAARRTRRVAEGALPGSVARRPLFGAGEGSNTVSGASQQNMLAAVAAAAGGGGGGGASPFAAALAQRLNGSDGAPTRADAAQLLERLRSAGAAAPGAPPPPPPLPASALAVSAGDSAPAAAAAAAAAAAFTATAFNATPPPPVWYTCPPWNGTAEERAARCSLSGAAATGAATAGGRDPNGYVHLLSAREGMSAWTHVIWEMLRFAKSLNRTFVEPCVAGGEIVPCTPGRVHMVPESVRRAGGPAAVTSRRDPLRVKAFLGACGVNGRGRGIEKRAARSYPLRLYLDLRSLRQYYRKVISFDEWVAAELCDCPDGELRWDGRRLHAELGYCVAWGPRAAQIRSSWCAPDQGPYRFGAVWAPRVMPEGMPHWVRDGRFQGHMFYYTPELRADGRRNLFFWNVWRGSFEPAGTHKKPPRFNEIHAAAVDAWLGDRLGLAAPQYAAFQWRSEQVDEAAIYPCALEMARLARPVVDAIRGPELAGGVLVADIPAPNNPCMMWKEYHASNRNMSEHRRAVRKLLSTAGLVKYDRDHPGLDAGVLSIRDWLLATRAPYYVTCSGTHDKCRACFRAGSKFIGRIVEARRAHKLSSWTRWFDLTPKALFALGSVGPPRPYNATAGAPGGGDDGGGGGGVPGEEDVGVGAAAAAGDGVTAKPPKPAVFSYNKPVM